MAVTVFFRLLALGTELTLPPVLSLVAKLPLLRVRVLRAVLTLLAPKLVALLLRIRVLRAVLALLTAMLTARLLRIRILVAVLTLLTAKLPLPAILSLATLIAI